MPKDKFVVVPHQDEWEIAHGGRHIGPYHSQQAAIDAAVDAAQEAGKRGHEAQVLIQDPDQRFRTEWTYGTDPYPPKV